jgi:hypothetical protein
MYKVIYIEAGKILPEYGRRSNQRERAEEWLQYELPAAWKDNPQHFMDSYGNGRDQVNTRSAWFVVYVEEPEINEWGEVCP